jgi:hypothetical protein
MRPGKRRDQSIGTEEAGTNPPSSARPFYGWSLVQYASENPRGLAGNGARVHLYIERLYTANNERIGRFKSMRSHLYLKRQWF